MLSIQPAGVKEISLIRKLAYEIWPAAYNTILSAGQLQYVLQLMYSEEALINQMREGQQFYIAYDNGVPAGFAAFGTYGATTYKLHKIYVLPQMQGKGTGGQLLQFVIEKVKENTATALILNVNRQNSALHFYKKMGFEIAEEVNIDIGRGYFMNDYIMKLAL
ncbi:GNAT family N-acetyltransferase [Ilyomonas limi]|uniref:GNAT family N-acetyltransferase n=1 Tax=Ilyomonas limi TaxID=2575867 RepID=A0A4U3L1S8_9BACT|nr:GNAT family N-acetyltransferase [Ilyomonas limi]TKK68958.1 GNAT family N-acetyltransferase [Ilyomonas limi]